MPRKGQRIKGDWYDCQNCSKTFWRHKSWSKKWTPKFCGKKCRDQSMIADVKNYKEIIDYYQKGNGVLKTGKHCGWSRSIVERVLRQHNVRIRTRDHYKVGANNPNYKGGYITEHGYKRHSLKGLHVLEHRMVMEKFLGRELDSAEHVHHLNGNKLDNRVENLAILTPRKHGALHAKEYRNWKKMYQDRIFDLESRICRLKSQLLGK